MLAMFLAAVTDPTVPTTSPLGASDDVASPAVQGKGFAAGIWDVISGTIDNLGQNGYQTGLAVIVTTVAIVAMLNLSLPKWILAPVGIGAVWAGWLGWNTLTAQDNPLFPGDVSATKLWDVAFTSDTGFLLVVIVACVAAVFLWRKSAALVSRIMLLVGAILGASFVYNLFEAFRVA